MSRARRPAARTAEPQSLGAVLDGLGREPRLASGLLLGSLGQRWADVVGDRLAEESTPVSLTGGVLLVRATTASWAAQIRFLAKEIGRESNRILGAGVGPGRGHEAPVRAEGGPPIREVRVVVDPGREDR